MDIEIDVNKLISEVKKRNLLWDITNEFFCNREETANAWAEICRTFVPDYDSRNSTAKRKVEDFLKNKWKNPRDTFVKILKAGTIGKTSFKYEKDLMFLHDMYCAKIKTPPHKPSDVKKTETRSTRNKRVENTVPPSDRTLRKRSVIVSETPSSGDESDTSEDAPRRASEPVELYQNKAVWSEDFTVVEPNCSTSHGNSRTPGTASKRLKSIKKVAVGENYTVEEPNSSSLETDDASSGETENEIIKPNVDGAGNQLERFIQQTLRSTGPSNYLSIVPMPSSRERVDEDVAFFNSIMTWIRQFNENEKLEFRAEVLNLIYKIRNHQDL